MNADLEDEDDQTQKYKYKSKKKNELLKKQSNSSFIMQASQFKVWDDRIVIIQNIDGCRQSEHYRLEGKLHRQNEYSKIHYDEVKQKITREKLDTVYNPVGNFQKYEETPKPIGDYIEITYFGEKHNLETYKRLEKIPNNLYGIEPVLIDNQLPPRVLGEPYHPDPSYF